MTTLLQISDTHFGTEVTPVAEALLELAHQAAPDVIVWSGDITQRSRRAQWAAAREFSRRLPPAPQLALPGNHDIALFNLPQRLIDPYGSFVRAFGPQLEATLELPDLLLMGVNTTRRWRHVNGEISAAQVARVAQRARTAPPSQWRVAVTHQPLHVRTHGEQHNLLRGHAHARAVWIDAGVDLVLGGHIHLPYVERIGSERSFLWAVQAGTAVSHRTRGAIPNSVNLLRLPAGRAAGEPALVERWDFDRAAGEFRRATVTRCTPASRPG